MPTLRLMNLHCTETEDNWGQITHILLRMVHTFGDRPGCLIIIGSR
jgi:hypothetical protein